MKRIVEKYSEVTMTLEEAIDLAKEAVYYDRKEGTDTDTKTHLREVAESVRKFKNKDEILLSEVEEDSIICRQHMDGKIIYKYTDDESIAESIKGAYNIKEVRITIKTTIKRPDETLYVAKNRKEALKWLIKE